MKAQKLLLIDDDIELRQVFERLISFRFPKLEIFTASNGEEAISHLGNFTPSLVITDCDMPLMNGLMFTKVFKETFPSVPIIMVSGNPDAQDMFYLLKGDAFYTKPATVEVIQSMKLFLKADELAITNEMDYVGL